VRAPKEIISYSFKNYEEESSLFKNALFQFLTQKQSSVLNCYLCTVQVGNINAIFVKKRTSTSRKEKIKIKIKGHIY
jgi:hypothetical protein